MFVILSVLIIITNFLLKWLLLYHLYVPAPALTVTPSASPPSMSSLPRPNSDTGDEKHSSLIIVIGICVGVVIIVFISVLIIYSCMSGKGRKRISVKETGMHFKFSLCCLKQASVCCLNQSSIAISSSFV